jgi:hypothetical protein
MKQLELRQIIKEEISKVINKYSIKHNKKGYSIIKNSTGDEITSFDTEEEAKKHAEKLNKIKFIPKEKFNEGFQGDDGGGDGLSGFRGGNTPLPPESEEDKIWRKNREDILKFGLEGAGDWKRGVDVNYGPYKDHDSFEYMYWKKGWEEADLAAAKRASKKLE